ncbi:MAG: alpha-amylase family glycosyl hydrolase, partial [Gammaproteobacteria bacterium]
VAQPENYALMGDLRALVAGYQRRFMVSEAPDDPIGFGSLGAGSSAFAFGHQTDILAAARGDASAAARVANYFPGAPLTMSTMLSNHDSFAGTRVWNQLNGNESQYRLAAATYLLQPGTPFIYYGEEIGMSTAPLAGDPGLRPPMSWSVDASTAGFTTGTPFRALASNAAARNVAAQSADPGSLLSFYKAMLALRNTRPSIARGSYVQAKAQGPVLSFRRELDGEATLVVINYGSAAAQANIQGLRPGAVLQALYPAAAASGMAADEAGRVAVAAGAQSVQVFALR